MFIADLHIHSKYSRATSKDCDLPHLEWWARRKGIDLLGTGDFTHPAWRAELEEKLSPAEEGLYCLKEEFRLKDGGISDSIYPRFVITGEISSIYKKNGRVRKVHNLIILPDLEAAQALSLKLEAIGNLHSDGRPILGLDSRDLLEITLETCADAIFIPAHIWTPHFSLLGAFSGFDSIAECFEDLTPHIHALETGLSSDPPMNWRLSSLDPYLLVSNSDAHSPQKLGREANIFDTELSYSALWNALTGADASKFSGTIEFFPEEGKYHYDGHLSCGICLKPEETVRNQGICPVCGKKITIGVLHRVEQLADRMEGFLPSSVRSFESIVPLPEIIAASTGHSVLSKKNLLYYDTLLSKLGSEFSILRQIPMIEIEQIAGPCIAEGIRRVRTGQIDLSPGYDGEYGKIQILTQKEIQDLSGQLCLFSGGEAKKDSKRQKKRQANIPIQTTTTVKESEKEVNISPKNLYGLDESQQSAILSDSPVVAVVAGPGTGKTKTLISKIIYLIEKRGVKPSEITAVTFTNQAAEEIQKRLQQHFNRRTANSVVIGTFHAICLRLLQQKGICRTLAGEQETLAVLQEVIDKFALNDSPKKLLHLISQRKNSVFSEEVSALSEEVYLFYQQLLEQYGIMDYDDLLLLTLDACKDEKFHKSALFKHFSYLLVDEFQDINEIQYQLILSLYLKELFVIGDPDQSIYGFRGADASCFKRLSSDFTNIFFARLSHNYRSTPQILNCALSVIEKNSSIMVPRTLTPQRENGANVRLLTAKDDFSQAVFIAKEINRKVGGIDMLDLQTLAGHDTTQVAGFSDIAVLYRTHRQAELLEECLRKEGIPYMVTGRDMPWDDPVAQMALSFFQCLLFPQDSAALCICLKCAGCPEDLIKNGLELLKAGDSISRIFQVVSQQVPHNISLAKLSLLSERLAPHVEKKQAFLLLQDWAKSLELMANPVMQRLLHTAVLCGNMPHFLRNISLGGESDISRSSNHVFHPDSVSLMTLHASKGLEFPVVFLCGIKDGCIPLKSGKKRINLEEERRLFYVGMTRAQNELILLTSPEFSPFLQPLPESSLNREMVNELRDAPAEKQLSFF